MRKHKVKLQSGSTLEGNKQRYVEMYEATEVVAKVCRLKEILRDCIFPLTDHVVDMIKNEVVVRSKADIDVVKELLDRIRDEINEEN